MKGREFWRVRGRVIELHGEGRYREALAVAEEARWRFPEKEAETSYWIACLKCLLGEVEEALCSLQGALEKGHWWGERWLLGDPDLALIQDRPEFRRIVEACRKCWEAAQAKAKPELLVLPPRENAGKMPLLIALHWFGGTAEEFVPYWEGAWEAGFLVAVPQSSQVVSEDGYGWNDQGLATLEIALHWEKLRREYGIDPDRVVIAGASQGGRLAIELALAGELILARGFIAVVPAIREPEELAARAERAAERGLRGWILIGEHDHFRPQVEEFCTLACRAGLSCELEVVLGLSHDFPEDFPQRLQQALSFISRNN